MLGLEVHGSPCTMYQMVWGYMGRTTISMNKNRDMQPPTYCPIYHILKTPLQMLLSQLLRVTRATPAAWVPHDLERYILLRKHSYPAGLSAPGSASCSLPLLAHDWGRRP